MVKKKKRRLRWGRILIAVFLCLDLIVGIVAFGTWKYVEYRLNHGENTYIAIIGTDERKNQTEPQRADVVMLASVNFQTSTVRLITMPRDSLVHIPCADKEDKITHAYRYGQRACTIDTLEELFEIDSIPRYVQVNFDSLITLVDDLGGITLKPSKTFCEYNVGKTKEYCFEEGVSTQMDGAMALAYSRHRKSDSDIYRGQRQQEVLMAMITKAKKLDLSKAWKLGQKVLGEVDTNITLTDALTYYKLATREEFTLSKDHAVGSDYWYNGVYYYRLKDSWIQQTIESIHKSVE